ncbi:14057_t:CDS:2, partial [Funneliformis caledonium]
EWINDIQTYLRLFFAKYDENIHINYAISLVNATIKLQSGIDSFEKLHNALKEDFSFTVFKYTNKKKLQSLKYIPEREGGDTSKFLSNFRQLCYNAEINDIEEQKNYFYLSLSNNYYNLNEFYKKMKNIKSTNELIQEFGKIIIDKPNLIRNGCIVALKHIATGKYLSSISGLCYPTGSTSQLVFANNLLDSDALWNIEFTSGKELASYTDTKICLQYKNSSASLGIYYYGIYKSPVTQHTEVSCNFNSSYTQWKFNNSKIENDQGYLKSNDIINIKNVNLSQQFLRSHDFQFTIGNDTFQEVVCHNKRLGGNDE